MSEELARKAFEEALQGHFNGYGAEELGGAGWFQVYDEARRIAEQDGAEYGVRAIQAAIRTNQHGLMRLMARGEPTPQPLCPALPDEAQQVYAHEAPCGGWLDAYIAYASQAVPQMVPAFHEAAGLTIVATAIARRLVFRDRAGDMFPNLYTLFVAESGFGKTLSFKLMKKVMQAAGLRRFQVTDQFTPENLLTQMSLVIPSTLNGWEQQAQTEWLEERAFAAQRVWLVDEASFLFDSLSRDYMAGVLGLMLTFYGCEESVTREVQSGGRIIARNISLSFFGSSTPVGMRDHLTNEKFWHDGLWARFALIMPESKPAWIDDFDSTPLDIPQDVIRHLRHMLHMFPLPTATREKDTDGREYVQVHGKAEPSSVHLQDGVYAAWKAYLKATSHTLRQAAYMDTMLQSSYNRFAEMAMKVAMILATMDSESLPVSVSLAHWARAQRIVEGWRASMHRIWSEQVKVDEEHLAERVLAKLREARVPQSSRWLQQQLHKRAKEINTVLEMLEAADAIMAQQEGKKRLWRIS